MPASALRSCDGIPREGCGSGLYDPVKGRAQLLEPDERAYTMIRAVVFDFDGVIRRWLGNGAVNAERAAGLPPGTFDGIAYGVPHYRAAKLGLVSHAAWLNAVRQELVGRYGEERTARAMCEFEADHGELDVVMASIVQRLRAELAVAVLSNTTDVLREEIIWHGLSEAFSYVFSSAELGFGKPDMRVFRRVEARMDVRPSEILFFDDLEPNVIGAERAGWTSFLFEDSLKCASQIEAETGIRVLE